MPGTPEEIAAQNRAIELNQKKQHAPPLKPPTVPQDSLETVLQSGSTTIYSEGGSGGAILVMPGDNLAVGAAIKVEDAGAVKVAQKCSQMMDSFFQNANGNPPFAAPRVTTYTASDFARDPALEAQLRTTFTSLANTPNAQRDGFKDAQKSVDKVATGQSAVMMMEFAEGKQVNRLPVEDKVALMKTEAFPQAIGRAMAPTMALGLCDHAGLSQSGSFKANISNFMYSPESGTLSVIDYDTGKLYDASGDVSKMRMGIQNPASYLEKMRTFLEDAGKSPENFEAAIDKMVDPNVDETEIPFAAIMRSFDTTGYDSMFFHKTKAGPGEGAALKSVSPQEMRQFAANLLVGAADGLGYVQQNQQALEHAVQQTHEVDGNGNKVEHFYTKREMDDMRAEMNKLDAPTLKNNLQQCMDARQQSLKSSVEVLNGRIKEASDRLSDVEAKIDRIRNHPTASDRLKSLFSTKANDPLVKLVDEREQLKEQLRQLRSEKPEAQIKTEFAEYTEKMQTQAKLPPLPKVPPPDSNNNNVVTTTTSTQLGNNGQGVDQSQGNKPTVSQHRSLRDLHPELDHSHGTHHGEEQGLKTGEKSPKLKEVNDHHSLKEDHPEFAKHLSQSRSQSQEQSQGPHIKQ